MFLYSVCCCWYVVWFKTLYSLVCAHTLACDMQVTCMSHGLEQTPQCYLHDTCTFIPEYTHARTHMNTTLACTHEHTPRMHAPHLLHTHAHTTHSPHAHFTHHAHHTHTHMHSIGAHCLVFSLQSSPSISSPPSFLSGHIQENLEDELVQEALSKGLDLRQYSREIESELCKVELRSVQDCILGNCSIYRTGGGGCLNVKWRRRK